MKVVFVVPSDGFLPSGTVRVRQYLSRLAQDGVGTVVISYYSPVLDGFMARCRARGRGTIAIPAAQWLQAAYRWWARLRILWHATSREMVFFQGVLPPVWFVTLLTRVGRRVVLDLDDAIYLGNPSRGAAVAAAAWKVVAGSHDILAFAERAGASAVLVPSAVTVARFAGTPPLRTGSAPVRIGWIGSESTVHYLKRLAEPLQTLVQEGHALEVCIDGVAHDGGVLSSIPGLAVSFTPAYTEADIPQLVARYDIGVMPLDDGPWERAKCAMKILVYMASARPAVASPVGENRYAVEDGVTGCLPETTEQWTTTLRGLIHDAAFRQRLGAAGRAAVARQYDVNVCYAALRTHIFGQAPSTDGVNQ